MFINIYFFCVETPSVPYFRYPCGKTGLRNDPDNVLVYCSILYICSDSQNILLAKDELLSTKELHNLKSYVIISNRINFLVTHDDYISTKFNILLEHLDIGSIFIPMEMQCKQNSNHHCN